jgi:membrane associated rhomboid family serine protease
MGVYDRDYYREEQRPPAMEFGGQMMVTKLVIVTAAIFFVDLFTKDRWLTNTLSITPGAIRDPLKWWQFLTYGFVHRDIWHLFWNMFVLWMFGREVEQRYGRKELLRIYLLVLVLGSLVWCVEKEFIFEATYRLLGASGAVTAIILLFVFNFPKRTILLMFVLPVPAWVLGVIVIGGDLLQFTKPLGGDPDAPRVAFDVHLVGAAFAICYFYFGWNIGRLLPGGGGIRSAASRLKRRPKLKIHDPDQRYEKQDEAADRILEKVSREGMDSLTSKERRILEEYSRRMRQKHR